MDNSHQLRLPLLYGTANNDNWNEIDFTEGWSTGKWIVNLIPGGGNLSVAYDIACAIPGLFTTCNKAERVAGNCFKALLRTIATKIAQILWIPVVFCAVIKTAIACWNLCFPKVPSQVTEDIQPEETDKDEDLTMYLSILNSIMSSKGDFTAGLFSLIENNRPLTDSVIPTDAQLLQHNLNVSRALIEQLPCKTTRQAQLLTGIYHLLTHLFLTASESTGNDQRLILPSENSPLTSLGNFTRKELINLIKQKYDEYSSTLNRSEAQNIASLLGVYSKSIKQGSKKVSLVNHKPITERVLNDKNSVTDSDTLIEKQSEKSELQNKLRELHSAFRINFPTAAETLKTTSEGYWICETEALLWAFKEARKSFPNESELYLSSLIIQMISGENAVISGQFAFISKELHENVINLTHDSSIKGDESHIYTTFNKILSGPKVTNKKKFIEAISCWVRDMVKREATTVKFNNYFEGTNKPLEILTKAKTVYLEYLQSLDSTTLQQHIFNAFSNPLISSAIAAFDNSTAPDMGYFSESHLKSMIFDQGVSDSNTEKVQDHFNEMLQLSRIDEKLIEELAEKAQCKKNDVEQIVRIKFLHLMLIINQSNMAAIADNIVTFKPDPLLMTYTSQVIIFEKSLDAYNLELNLKLQNPDTSEKVMAVGKTSLQIDHLCSPQGSIKHKVIDHLRFDSSIEKNDLDLLIQHSKPALYIDQFENTLAKLHCIDSIQQGDFLFYDNQNSQFFIAKDQSKLNNWTWGIFASYQSPDETTLKAIKRSVENAYEQIEKIEKILQNNNSSPPDFSGWITELDNLQNKLDAMVDSKVGKNSEILNSINSKRLQIKEIIKLCESRIKVNNITEDELKTDRFQNFIGNLDIEELQKELKTDTLSATNFINRAYETYQKSITHSTKVEDFIWKSHKYHTIIGQLQKFSKELLNRKFNPEQELLKSFHTINKNISVEVENKTSILHKPLIELMEELHGIKISSEMIPEDKKTTDYQDRVRSLYYKFFIKLTSAAEQALEYKNNIKFEEDIELDWTLIDDNELHIDDKLADIILEMCHAFFTAVSVKAESRIAVETFCSFDKIKNLSLISSSKEVFNQILNADRCRKTPIHHWAFKSLKGHANFYFNGWLAGNPVSRWLELHLGEKSIDLLAFGSPTNEITAAQAEILPIFKAIMKQYEKEGKKHLYVSLQNLIPLKNQTGWKSYLAKLPLIVGNSIGGDETNRIKALIEFEGSAEGAALYFMNLSKNSNFYNKPVALEGQKGNEVDRLSSSKKFKEKLFSQLFEEQPQKSGNYISQKIKADYKGKTNETLQEWSKKTIEQIHLLLFPQKLGFQGGCEDLTLEERKLFIEYFYYFFELEIAMKLGVDSMNTSCKDDIDRGIGESTKIFGIQGIINNQQDEVAFKEDFITQLFARALFVRQREIIGERMERLLDVVEFSLNNKDKLQNIHDIVWPNLPMRSQLI